MLVSSNGSCLVIVGCVKGKQIFTLWYLILYVQNATSILVMVTVLTNTMTDFCLLPESTHKHDFGCTVYV